MSNADLSNLLQYCYKGDFEMVKQIIESHKPQDILDIKGEKYKVNISSGRYLKNQFEVAEWNPILYAIS